MWLTGQSGAGSEILLNVVSDTVVEGRVGGAGALAFTIEINPTTGEVTITQAATFEHTVDDLTPEAHDDALTLGAAVNVVQHVTDGDGDSSEVTSATSLQVTFQDDGPTAHNDGSSAVRLVQREDTAATIDAFANDHLGADGGDFDNVVFTQGARGSVTYDPTTNLFTYTPNPAVGGIDFFTYTIQDGDGDTSTATVFVDVDSKPQVGVPQNLVVDEDGLVGHNVDGNPVLRPGETDSTESATQTGSVVVDYIHDQPLPANLPGSIELLDTDSLDNQLQTLAGTDVVFALEGGKLVGRPLGGGNPVVTIEFTGFVDDPGNLVTYNYQATLNQPVKHAGAGEDTVILSDVSFKVTDADGSSGFGFFNVTIVDDAPIVSVSAAADSLTVDETNLAANASANFADNFAASYGADGAGTTTYALNVSSAGVDSGLDDTATGSNILLFKEGNDIVGRVGSAAGAVSFIVGVDTNGNVSLDQQRAILHTPNSGPDQDATLSAANLISLTATITDQDGDTASAPINIGTSLHFHDDAPIISVSAAADSLTVDETDLAANALANFADNFTASYRADGAGTTTYALNVSSAGVDSGLDDTATGSNILLFKEGNDIVGRVGSAAGAISFIVGVAANGTVSLDQQRAILHTPNSGPDQDATLSAANLISLTATITDKDGDTASAPIEYRHLASLPRRRSDHLGERRG